MAAKHADGKRGAGAKKCDEYARERGRKNIGENAGNTAKKNRYKPQDRITVAKRKGAGAGIAMDGFWANKKAGKWRKAGEGSMGGGTVERRSPNINGKEKRIIREGGRG